MAPTLREETTAPQSYSTEEAQRLLIAESRAAEKAEAKAAKAKARTKATILRKPAGVTKSDLKSGSFRDRLREAITNLHKMSEDIKGMADEVWEMSDTICAELNALEECADSMFVLRWITS